MSTSGSVEGGDFLWVLRKISAGEERGLLSIQGEQDLVSITFERGMIVAADAMNHPAEEMLGEVLANEGWLSPADFSAAVLSAPQAGKLASEILAAAGVLEERRLLRAVRLQTYRQALRVLRWRTGNFDWTSQVESPYHRGVEPISVAELLLRATEELGSEGPLTGAIPELDTVFEINPDHRAEIRPLEQRSEGPPPVETDHVWLTRWERTLFQNIDGRQPASLLMLQTGFDPFQVKYGLYTLARQRLIRVRHQVSASNPLHQALPTGVRSTDILDQIEPLGGVDDGPASSSLVLDPGILDPIDATPPPRPRSVPQRSTADSSPPARLDSELEGGLRSGFVSAQLEELLESGSVPTVEVPARLTPWSEVAAPWLARTLALGLIALLAATFLSSRERDTLLLPFSWLEVERTGLDRVQRLASYAKIDQAIRAYQLLYGRYPEDLGLLADLELLGPADLYDPEGSWLSYQPGVSSYVLRPVRDGEPVDELAATSSSATDFLLNPRYVDPSAASTGRSVVLID